MYICRSVLVSKFKCTFGTKALFLDIRYNLIELSTMANLSPQCGLFVLFNAILIASSQNMIGNARAQDQGTGSKTAGSNADQDAWAATGYIEL